MILVWNRFVLLVGQVQIMILVEIAEHIRFERVVLIEDVAVEMGLHVLGFMLIGKFDKNISIFVLKVKLFFHFKCNNVKWKINLPF